MNNPRALREVILEIGHVRLELITLEGVFSSKRLDPGSLTLLRNLPALPSTGHVLDLGCGYGAVGLAIAAQSPGLTIWATDEDDLALALCRLNASRLGLTNVRVARPDRFLPTSASLPSARIGRCTCAGTISFQRWSGG